MAISFGPAGNHVHNHAGHYAQADLKRQPKRTSFRADRASQRLGDWEMGESGFKYSVASLTSVYLLSSSCSRRFGSWIHQIHTYRYIYIYIYMKETESDTDSDADADAD